MQLTIQAPSIMLCNEAVDFRLGIDGLIKIAVNELNASLQETIFVFYNRPRTKLKILAWHRNGFILLLKRLERGHFFSMQNEPVATVTPQQLSWLLAGLDWITMSSFGELEYRDFN